jgi:hypothetical protein
MTDDTTAHRQGLTFHRRDLMKMGAGAAFAAMQAPGASAQSPLDSPVPKSEAAQAGRASAGFARAFGNGPVDDTTRSPMFTHSPRQI